MRLVIATMALAGCAYEAGSFRSPGRAFAGEHLTVGCLDLSIERRPDLARGDVVIGYVFGNRCDHPALVDLGAAELIGHSLGSGPLSLPPYDPNREIAPMWLDGRAVGSEAISYACNVPLRKVCVDASSIAHEPAGDWLCFGSGPQLSEVP